MSATTDFVGVRRFSNLSSTIAKIDTRDSTVIGLVLPAPAADNVAFPLNEPVKLSIDNVAQVAALGAGMARDTVDQVLATGIVTDIAFVRVQHSTLTDPTAKLEAEINSIVGSAGSKTGVWALLDAKAEIKIEPGCIIAPGYMAHRTGGAANAVVTAAKTVADRIIDCMVIADTPVTSVAAALAWAEDFKTSLNVIAMYPQAVVNLGAGNVVRPLSAHVAAAMVRRDKETGGPYKAFWNRELTGVLGPSIPVGYTDGDISSEANQLAQGGVGSIIEGNLLWAPFTTATDPTVKSWRSVKKIRTRRAIEKAMLKPLRQYPSEDVTPHMVTLIYLAADQFLADLVTLGALIDYELIWSKALNSAAILEAGALRVKTRFAETPDLVDLQIYDEPMPEAFDVLEAAIASVLSSLGNNNIRVTA